MCQQREHDTSAKYRFNPLQMSNGAWAASASAMGPKREGGQAVRHPAGTPEPDQRPQDQQGREMTNPDVVIVQRRQATALSAAAAITSMLSDQQLRAVHLQSRRLAMAIGGARAGGVSRRCLTLALAGRHQSNTPEHSQKVMAPSLKSLSISFSCSFKASSAAASSSSKGMPFPETTR